MPPPLKSKAQTYYLSQDLSPRVKSLSDLSEDWEKQVATVLLGTSGTKADEIRRLLPSKTERTNNAILDLLPRGIKNRGRILLHHLLPRVSLGDGDVVILPPNGTATAPLIDVLRFFASPKSMRVPVPTGAGHLIEFFRSRGFPQSAFGAGRLGDPCVAGASPAESSPQVPDAKSPLQKVHKTGSPYHLEAK